MSLFVAMIVLESAEMPDAAILRSALSERSFSDFESRDSVVAFTLDDVLINCGLVSAPIPQDELRPILRTSPYWREDDAVIFAHQAHLIVAASGDFEKKRLALVLTTAITALLRATGCAIAVYWGAGSVITSKEIFCDFADSATLDQLPLYLWIDFRCYPERGGCALFTQGLQSLGFMEIEVSYSSAPPGETVGLAFNVAHYLLDHGAVLKHGDTIGMSAEQKLKITHAPSAHERNEKVYHLELG